MKLFNEWINSREGKKFLIKIRYNRIDAMGEAYMVGKKEGMKVAIDIVTNTMEPKKGIEWLNKLIEKLNELMVSCPSIEEDIKEPIKKEGR